MVKFLEKLKNPYLSEEEKEKLRDYVESGGVGLAPKTAASFFELYLNGSSVQEIHKLNPAFPYGAILRARVEYDWDEQKDKYIRNLQSGVFERMVHTQLEAVSFLASVMSVTHKKYGDAFKKYLQTGDESELKGFDVGSIRSYKDVIESLLKISGQEKKKIEFSAKTGHSDSNSPLENLASKPISPDVGAKLLAILAEEEND